MVSSSEPKIKEDIKRDILAYLVRSIREEAPLENINYLGIINEIDESSEKIDLAIEELEAEDTISSHDISLKIYLPETEEGKNVLKRLTEEEALAYSPYLLVIFSLLIFWVAMPYLNLQLPSDFTGTILLNAYREGLKSAIIFSAIVGTIGAYFLKSIILKLKKIKILSPTLYRNMNDIMKITIALSILGALVYRILESDYGLQLTNAALSYFLGSMAIALTYVFARKRDSEENESM